MWNSKPLLSILISILRNFNITLAVLFYMLHVQSNGPSSFTSLDVLMWMTLTPQLKLCWLEVWKVRFPTITCQSIERLAAAHTLLATNFITKPDVYSKRSHCSNGGHKFQPVGYSSHITTNQLCSPCTRRPFTWVRGNERNIQCDVLFLISINYQHTSGEAQIKILIWQSKGKCATSIMDLLI